MSTRSLRCQVRDTALADRQSRQQIVFADLLEIERQLAGKQQNFVFLAALRLFTAVKFEQGCVDAELVCYDFHCILKYLEAWHLLVTNEVFGTLGLAGSPVYLIFGTY